MARVALLVAVIDLVTKAIADVLWSAAPHPLLSWLSLSVVHNVSGAFGWSAGAYTWQLNLALTLCAVAFVLPVTRDLAAVDARAPRALGLIVGGAVGNLASLVLPPAGVADFIAIRWQPGHSLVLNVADLAAYAGLAMILRTGLRIALAIRDQTHAASRVRLGSAYARKAQAKLALHADGPGLTEAVVHDWSNVVDIGVVRADAPPVETPPRRFPRPMGAAREKRLMIIADRPLSLVEPGEDEAAPP